MTKTQPYYLKRQLDLRGNLPSCELQWESVGVPLTETGQKCALAVELQDWPSVHAHIFLYDSCVMMFECTRLNGRKVSDWLRLSRAQWQESLWLAETLLHDKRAVFNWEGSVRLSHPDYMTDTQLEYGDLVNGTAFPWCSEGNQLM